MEGQLILNPVYLFAGNTGVYPAADHNAVECCFHSLLQLLRHQCDQEPQRRVTMHYRRLPHPFCLDVQPLGRLGDVPFPGGDTSYPMPISVSMPAWIALLLHRIWVCVSYVAAKPPTGLCESNTVSYVQTCLAGGGVFGAGVRDVPVQ